MCRKPRPVMYKSSLFVGIKLVIYELIYVGSCLLHVGNYDHLRVYFAMLKVTLRVLCVWNVNVP